MQANTFDIVVIGGSSGCIPVLLKILEGIPASFSIPVVIVVHRLQNVASELDAILSVDHLVQEPEDKEPLLPGHIYLAPQNYHLLLEDDKTFLLDYSEKVYFSRPSIDVTFTNVAEVFRERALGILLSGANKDGSTGCADILDNGGTVVVQDPFSAEYAQMPEEAIKRNPGVNIKTPSSIAEMLSHLMDAHNR